MNTIPEAKLPALAAGKSIAHIRAIDSDDNPVNATPTQAAAAIAPAIAPMLGIDYSILTEQAIPGEYFIDRDGNKKQVYVKTLRGTYPTTMPQYNVIEHIVPSDHPSLLLSIHAAAIADNEIMWCLNADKFSVGKHGGLSQYFNTPEWLGKEYIITIKYTKR